jgi:hypothetical protein
METGMAPSSVSRDYRRLIPAASLIVGPLIMTIGDLLHPEERMAPQEQIAIVANHASRWYTAHLLLFIGLMLFIPGFLALTDVTEARRPAAGYAARILLLAGTAAFASIFVMEMLIGRFALDGTNPNAAIALLDSMFSGPIFAAIGPTMLAFFVGIAAFALPLVRTGGPFGWAAGTILIGTLFILAEILSAQVILSQIGNFLALCGSATAAWLMLHGATTNPTPPNTF